MTQTTTTRKDTPSGNGAQEDRRPFVAGETEARPGLITTEFWLTLLGSLVVIIGAYVDDGVRDRWGWILATVIIASYVLSRGIAKAGSKEGPFVVGGGER